MTQGIMIMERIEKYLANSLLITRRDAKELLKTNRVKVDEKTARAGLLISNNNIITLDGTKIEPANETYLMMNKSAGLICTKAEHGAATVFDELDEEYCCPRIFDKLHTIGRLDKDTTGLLILTTDGALTHKIISHDTDYTKTYEVKLKNPVTDKKDHITQLFKKGIFVLRDGREKEFRAKSAILEWQKDDECLLVIKEGKFHQVKRMFSAIGNEVIALKRVAIGNLWLDETLNTGEYRPLKDEELLVLSKGKSFDIMDA